MRDDPLRLDVGATGDILGSSRIYRARSVSGIRAPGGGRSCTCGSSTSTCRSRTSAATGTTASRTCHHHAVFDSEGVLGERSVHFVKAADRQAFGVEVGDSDQIFTLVFLGR